MHVCGTDHSSQCCFPTDDTLVCSRDIRNQATPLVEITLKIDDLGMTNFFGEGAIQISDPIL